MFWLVSWWGARARTLNPRINSLSGGSSLGFMRVRAAGQPRGAYSVEREPHGGDLQTQTAAPQGWVIMPWPSSASRRDLDGWRSAMGIQPVAVERCPELAEPRCAELAPVGELVGSIPAPRCDHRQHQDLALAEQAVIDPPIVLTDLSGRVGEVELDRPTAARLQIDEQQPVVRGEHVAWVRLAVQQLPGAAALADHPAQACQRGAEELAVRGGERRRVITAGHQLLSQLDPIGEARRRDIERAQAGVQPPERLGVAGR